MKLASVKSKEYDRAAFLLVKEKKIIEEIINLPNKQPIQIKEEAKIEVGLPDIDRKSKKIKKVKNKSKSKEGEEPKIQQPKINKRAQMLGFDEHIKVIEKRVAVWTGEYDNASNSYVDIDTYRYEVRSITERGIIGTFDSIYSFVEDIAMFREDSREGQFSISKYGYIHRSGKIISWAIFDDGYNFRNNYAVVGRFTTRMEYGRDTVEEKYGLLDKNGRLVIPCEHKLDKDFLIRQLSL
ncbi:MAG: WG repeat-containing protein [Lewinellaceae bacterium]|nr:WG repeat-containing protein [Lewinellaceae bacterium]